MQTRQTAKLAAGALVVMFTLLGGFYVYFNPHVLHSLIAETWTTDGGDELTSWPDRPYARRCPRHDAYHTDGRICGH